MGRCKGNTTIHSIFVDKPSCPGVMALKVICLLLLIASVCSGHPLLLLGDFGASTASRWNGGLHLGFDKGDGTPGANIDANTSGGYYLDGKWNPFLQIGRNGDGGNGLAIGNQLGLKHGFVLDGMIHGNLGEKKLDASGRWGHDWVHSIGGSKGIYSEAPKAGYNHWINFDAWKNSGQGNRKRRSTPLLILDDGEYIEKIINF